MGTTAGEKRVVARGRESSGALMAEAIGQSDGATELAENSDLRALAELARRGGGVDAAVPARTKGEHEHEHE